MIEKKDGTAATYHPGVAPDIVVAEESVDVLAVQEVVRVVNRSDTPVDVTLRVVTKTKWSLYKSK